MPLRLTPQWRVLAFWRLKFHNIRLPGHMSYNPAKGPAKTRDKSGTLSPIE